MADNDFPATCVAHWSTGATPNMRADSWRSDGSWVCTFH